MNKVLAKVTRGIARVYIEKDIHQERKDKIRDPKCSGDKKEKPSDHR
jgi:hypothetical protein